MVGDDYTSTTANAHTGSTVDCPTELSTGGWSVTCAPPAAPTFMGYPDYGCPCSEVTFAGGTYPQFDGVYSLIQNPEDSINNGKPVYQHSSGTYLYSTQSTFWGLGPNSAAAGFYQSTQSAVDCPTELTGWSVTCVASLAESPPPSPPLLMQSPSPPPPSSPSPPPPAPSPPSPSPPPPTPSPSPPPPAPS